MTCSSRRFFTIEEDERWALLQELRLKFFHGVPLHISKCKSIRKSFEFFMAAAPRPFSALEYYFRPSMHSHRIKHVHQYRKRIAFLASAAFKCPILDGRRAVVFGASVCPSDGVILELLPPVEVSPPTRFEICMYVELHLGVIR